MYGFVWMMSVVYAIRIHFFIVKRERETEENINSYVVGWMYANVCVFRRYKVHLRYYTGTGTGTKRSLPGFTVSSNSQYIMQNCRFNFLVA